MSDYKQNTEQLKKIEEVKKIHREVINFMDSIGYGLLTDGETFYQKGMELEPREGITFTMRQAYEVTKTTPSHDEIKREVLMKFARYLATNDVTLDEEHPASLNQDALAYYNEMAKDFLALTQSKEGGE